MGYFIIGAIIIAMFSAVAILIHAGYSTNEHNTVAPWWWDLAFGAVPGIIIATLIIGIASLSIYVGGNNENAKLEAFFFANVAHLALAEDKLKEGIEGSIENTELYFLGYDAQQAGHITIYSNLVTTNLEEIKDYNVRLLRKYKWQDSFFQGWFMPNIDPTLKLVRVINP